MATTHKPNLSQNQRWLAIGLVVLTLAARGGVLAFSSGSLAGDPDGYRALAENVLGYGTLGSGRLPTAYRPPLYPLVLTVCVAFGPWTDVAVAMLHLAMGLATVWLVYRLGHRWGLGHYALLAAALVACDPILLIQSTLVMTETAATLLAVVSLVALASASRRPSPRRAMTAGACLALATLCRATFLPWLAVTALLLPAVERTWAGRLKLFGAFAGAAAVVLTPWVVRNQIQFGRPVVATTHGGYTLLLANNPSFYDYLRTGRWGTVWDADAFNQAWAARITPAGELENDRLAYAEARETIRRRPRMFVYSCFIRVGRLWSPLPHQVDAGEGAIRRWSRYVVGLWYLAEFALAAIGVFAVLKKTGPRTLCPSILGGGWLRQSEAVPQSTRPGASLRSATSHPRHPLREGNSQTWQPAWFWGFLLAACFTAVHALYWSNLRMRAPSMPVVALVAGAGTAWIIGGLRERKCFSEKVLHR